MDFNEYLLRQQKRVDEALDRLLPPEEKYPSSLHKAMRYSVFSGGKRLRPVLAIAAYEAVGGEGDHVLPYACALELIHTYSLIHDDLPAMDNDDYRRGRPTSHRMFGEGLAILAGDALLTEAFSLMTRPEFTTGLGDEVVLRVVHELSRAAGIQGMVGGQVVDLESEGKTVEFATVEWIHTHKTGALIVSAVRIGARLGGAGEETLAALTRYAEGVGLAFQITDDILNVEGEERHLGKRVGTDRQRGKGTYPAVIGIERSKDTARTLLKEAVEALDMFGHNADPLREIARFILERRS